MTSTDTEPHRCAACGRVGATERHPHAAGEWWDPDCWLLYLEAETGRPVRAARPKLAVVEPRRERT